MKNDAQLFILFILAGAFFGAAAAAGATQITVESRSFLPVREDANSKRHILFYQYADLDLEDVLVPGLFLEIGAWGRGDLATETYAKKGNGELQYGFVGYRAPRMNAEIRLGRVAVTGGAARNEVLDGLELRSDLPGGLDLLAFGGRPVETGDGGSSGDSIYGGRLSQGRPGIYRLGLSFLNERDNKKEARKEAAIDLWFRPGIPLVISGSSLYNAAADNFAQHEYRILAGPFFSRVRFQGNYSWVDYGAFFTSPGASAFVFPALDPQERLQIIGGEMAVDLGRGVDLAVEYANHHYHVLDTAQVYGMRLDWSNETRAAGFAYHRSHGADAELQYVEYRLSGSATFGRLKTAIGLQEVRYELPVNGKRHALAATLAADYALSKAFQAGADLEYGSNPFFRSEVKGLLRLTYRYSWTDLKGGAGK